MNPFNDGLPYELPPLSDYVVTERKPAPPELPKMDFFKWQESLPDDEKGYNMHGMRGIKPLAPKPREIEIVLSEQEAGFGYYLIWED